MSMEKFIYPAVFHREDDGTYLVTFPDLEGCLTYGDSLDEAFLMAGDALLAWLDAFKDAPAPSDIMSIKAGEGDLIQLVRAAPFGGRDEVQRKRATREIE